MNVGKQIIDCPLIRQNFSHQHQLCTGEVLWMGAANTLLEVMQLSRQMPVSHVGQPRGLRRPDTLAGSAVTGRAGRVERLASVRISRKRGSRALIRQ